MQNKAAPQPAELSPHSPYPGDVTDMLPRQMRPALLAAYARTIELGLTAIDVERALRASLERSKGG